MTNNKQAPSNVEVQVFELTMDNPEDQDELNRRLRKPGEAEKRPMVGEDAAADEPTSGVCAQDENAKSQKGKRIA